jgi:hypothetical protein
MQGLRHQEAPVPQQAASNGCRSDVSPVLFGELCDGPRSVDVPVNGREAGVHDEPPVVHERGVVEALEQGRVYRALRAAHKEVTGNLLLLGGPLQGLALQPQVTPLSTPTQASHTHA